MLKLKLFAAVLILVLASQAAADSSDVHTSAVAETASIERGRYLVKITGCNDCHTPGYGAAEGKIPESQWLTGDVVGWKGPWGTTYATNLRTLFSSLSEQDWLVYVRTGQARPPMPWYVLKQMTETDLRALYRFIRSLGKAGVAAPKFLDPDKIPTQPFIEFPPPPPPPTGMKRRDPTMN